MKRLVAISLAISGLGLGVLSSCAEPTVGSGATGVRTDSIIGGQPTAPGAWPAVAWLPAGCTAVMIHPRLIVFAAHCGVVHRQAWFGDDLDLRIDDGTLSMPQGDGLTSIALERCRTLSPEVGLDLGYCMTTTPYRGALAPMASEADVKAAIDTGAPFVLAGFGLTSSDATTFGQKQQVEVIDASYTEDIELAIGSVSAGTCRGDSGGPAFVAIDGEHGRQWRVAGVLSGGAVGECGMGYYTALHRHERWLESAVASLRPCADERTENCLSGQLQPDGLLADVTVIPPAPMAEGGCSNTGPRPAPSLEQVVYLVLLLAGLGFRLSRRGAS